LSVDTLNGFTRNFSYTSVAQVLIKLVSFGWFILLARMYGQEGLGNYAFALYFTSMFSFLTSLGTGQFVTREIARDRSKVVGYFPRIVIIRLMLGTLSMIIIVSYIIFSGAYSPEVNQMILLAGVMMVIDSISMLITNFFQGIERMEYSALINIVISLLRICFGLVGVLHHESLLVVFRLMLSASILSLFYSLYLMRTRILHGLQRLSILQTIDPAEIWTIVKKAAPFSLIGIIVVFYMRIDITMLSYMKGNSAVGIYSTAYRFIDSLLLIAGSFGTALYPLLSRLYETDRGRMMTVYRKSTKFICVLSLVIATSLYFSSDFIITAAFGAEFENATLVLELLAWSLIPSYLNWVLARVILSSLRERFIILSCFASFAVNVVLNLILIPRYAYYGAALATVISDFLLVTMNYAYIQKYLMKMNIVRILFTPVLVTGGCIAFHWFLGYRMSYTPPLVLSLGLFLLIIASVLIGTGYFNRSEREALSEILHTRLTSKKT
jgi:O-antigen/teichoic acid export membrane protein